MVNGGVLNQGLGGEQVAAADIIHLLPMTEFVHMLFFLSMSSCSRLHNDLEAGHLIKLVSLRLENNTKT